MTGECGKGLNDMSRQTDITGRKYGKLVALKESEAGYPFWIFQCDCGKTKALRKGDVTFGRTTSCGCHRDSVVVKRNKDTAKWGGLSQTGAGVSWQAMMTRCYNRNNHTYAVYGAVGINVCEFIRATPGNLVLLIGERPKGKTLDRINNLDSYHCGQCAECLSKGWPLNVKWSTPTQQGRNQKTNRLLTINGETHCVTEWAEIAGISESGLRDRIRRGKAGADLIAFPK
jgi:5-methylcytosine-specific restriction endonuclease McrA